MRRGRLVKVIDQSWFGPTILGSLLGPLLTESSILIRIHGKPRATVQLHSETVGGIARGRVMAPETVRSPWR
jgi:hypothetical protein